jgi:hypothetical protein
VIDQIETLISDKPQFHAAPMEERRTEAASGTSFRRVTRRSLRLHRAHLIIYCEITTWITHSRQNDRARCPEDKAHLKVAPPIP